MVKDVLMLTTDVDFLRNKTVGDIHTSAWYFPIIVGLSVSVQLQFVCSLIHASLSPSLISLVVSVDVKHYVYLLTYLLTPGADWPRSPLLCEFCLIKKGES